MSQDYEDENSEEEESEILEAVDRKRAKEAKEATKVLCLADMNTLQEYLRTGIPEIDSRVGGIPRACILQVAGKEGAGKTTVMLQASMNALRELPEDTFLGIIDFENRMQADRLRYFARMAGIDEKRVKYKPTLHGQDGLGQMLKWLEDPKCIIQLADSLKGVVDKKNIIKDIDKNAAAMANAKLCNEFFEKVLHRVRFLNKSLVFIDHLKEKVQMGSFFNINDSASGSSVKFYASARWFMTYYSVEKDAAKENKIAQTVKIVVAKSTVSDMAIIDNLHLIFKTGISSYKWYINKALEYSLMKRPSKTKKTFLLTTKGGDKEVATSIKGLREWITDPKNKMWVKIVERINEKEKVKFDLRMKTDPALLDSEFSV